MVRLEAFFIFLGITTVIWFVAIALYKAWVGEPDLLRHPNFWPTTLLFIFWVSLISLVPAPWGYFFTLGAWWLAARYFFELPTPKALALFLILGALSILSKLAVVGVLEMF